MCRIHSFCGACIAVAAAAENDVDDVHLRSEEDEPKIMAEDQYVSFCASVHLIRIGQWSGVSSSPVGIEEDQDAELGVVVGIISHHQVCTE